MLISTNVLQWRSIVPHSLFAYECHPMYSEEIFPQSEEEMMLLWMYETDKILILIVLPV